MTMTVTMISSQAMVIYQSNLLINGVAKNPVAKRQFYHLKPLKPLAPQLAPLIIPRAQPIKPALA